MSDPGSDPAVLREVERQFSILTRGCVTLVSEVELRKKLTRSIATHRPLRVKLGVDPTATLLHLGFTVVLGRMRAFQDLGHQAVLIIGDATAMVGDPTGRNATRPQLTQDDVQRNAASYLEQVAKVLDVTKLEVRWNGSWLSNLGFTGIIRLLSHTTIAQVMEREDFSKRFKEGVPIHLHEILYPLLQGYDSVEIRSDVELGGNEQLFNLLVGRDLQVAAGQEPQVCMTLPLLVGLDGVRKMSKSYGNTIGIAESPEDMFGKSMSLPDAYVEQWFTLLTDVPPENVKTLLEGHPRDAKIALARTLVERYHGAPAADAAVDRFRRVFSNKEVPDDIAELSVPASIMKGPGLAGVIDLTMLFGHLKSRSDARRLIGQGGITLNAERVTDPMAVVAIKSGDVLRAGKLHFGKLRLDG